MNLASLELCKELYELSGWNRTYLIFTQGLDAVLVTPYYEDTSTFVCPAYDLGYLLRRLDEDEEISLHRCHHQDGSRNWCAEYDDPSSEHINKFAYAKSPEDAAAFLAIELFKQRIFTKERE